MTRFVSTRDTPPSTFTAGYPRPDSRPLRHRERADLWTEPADGRSWTEEAFLGIGLVLTAAGILAACWLLTVLAFIAGPDR